MPQELHSPGGRGDTQRPRSAEASRGRSPTHQLTNSPTHQLTNSPTHCSSVLPLVFVVAMPIVVVVAEDAEGATDVVGDDHVVRLIEADGRRVDRRATLRLEPARRIDGDGD